MTAAVTPAARRLRTSGIARLQLVVPALVAYVPLLLTQPGWVGADTKTYLYLDPAKLLADAPWSWDSQIGMGTVTHQNIGYLFPMGPFYLLADLLGLPDWLAQRLWLGTLMFLAGAGVRFLLRTLRADRSGTEGADDRAAGMGVLIASLAYMLSPYLLDYSARISVILLPWVALPWLIAFTARALRGTGWRDPAIFTGIVFAVGAINATALLMIGLGPMLWIVYAVVVERDTTLRRAMATTAKIGVLTVVTSLWWIGGLWAEGKHGLPVIRYTETYRAVAGASNAPEVLRGFGYWFFYGSDKLGAWVEPSVYYTTNLPLLALSYALPIAAIGVAALLRWRHRGYFLVLLATGTLVAVAGHPWEGASVLGDLFIRFTRTNAGLSLRSTPRAVPLVALSTAVFLGMGVAAVGRRLPRHAITVTAGVGLLVAANMPTLWLGQMVAENLRRPEDIPAYWEQAATWLDAQPHDTRVMEMPGIEFASYTWGNTVDPVTPGLMTRPYVARELFQWGSPQSAALLNAFDRRLQEGTAEPEAVAPILRLLGVGHVLDRSGDLIFERYRTARPKQVWDLLRRAPGIGEPVAFTPVTPNPAGPEVPMLDEIELGQDPSLPDAPALTVFPVEDPDPIVRALTTSHPLVVSGDGDSLVDAAAQGLLAATQPVFFSGSFAKDPDGLRRLLDDGADLVLTDTNRKRAQRWGALRENTGYTERAGELPAVYDPGDQRLDVFPGSSDDHFTLSEQLGNALVTATAYGNPITYTPDDRPANAFDDDPESAWRVGALDSPIGERLIVDATEPVTTDHIDVVQPLNLIRNRWITGIRLHFDEGPPLDAELDLGSRVEPGQRISFPERTFRRLEIEIVADDIGILPRYDGSSGVGFSSVRIPGVAVTEAIRPPIDLLTAAGATSADHRMWLLFDRVRANPAEPVRTDEEPRMVRTVELPAARSFGIDGTARLSAWTTDDLVDRLLDLPDATEGGITITSSAFLPSSLDQRGRAAFDGDPTTYWSSIYDKQEGFWLKADLADPVTFDHLDLAVVDDGAHSIPTRLRIEADGRAPVVVDVPPIVETGRRGSSTTVRVDLPPGTAPITATSVRIVLDEVREIFTTDWYGESQVALPAAIVEVGIPGVVAPGPGPELDTGCRDDLLEIDGRPVPIRIHGTTADALARRGLDVESCGPELTLDAGRHVFRSVAGRTSGLDLDRLLFGSEAGGAAIDSAAELPARSAPAVPKVRVLDAGRTTYDLEITGGDGPFWLALGDSSSAGWHATDADGADLGPPAVISGFGNGWRLEADPGRTRTIRLEWTPQRVIWLGVWASVLGVIVTLGMICFGRRELGTLPPTPSTTGPPEPAHALGSERPESAVLGGWRDRSPVLDAVPTALLTVGVAAFAALNLPASLLRLPAVAGIAALTAVAARTGRRAWLGLAAAGSLAVAAGYFVLQQYRHRFPADFVWPQLFERAHIFGVVAVLLAGAEGARSAVLARRARSTPDGPTGEPAARAPAPPGEPPTI